MRPSDQPRPKIGLALEGGGALGLAHIGLLEWFAQHHIPIDYIAGSSMGGLVAGFYAAGVPPAEMHQTINHLDWNRIVNGVPDDQRLAYRRKQDVRELGNETLLGLRHKLILPTSFNTGEALDLFLGRVATPYMQLRSFDDLPTPFRCLATDLASSQAHVFDKGSLLEALRATMSIPGLFDPVIDGNHEYVDGGILNNLPVDLVKAMGADIVIAVHLKTDPFDPQKPQTLLNVFSSSLSAVIAANERHNMEAADLLLSINLAGVTSKDYSRHQEVLARGFEGAAQRELVLSKFALDDAKWSDYIQARKAKRRTAVPPLQFVEIQGIEPTLADVVRAYFLEVLDKPFEPERVEAQINKVMGVNVFAFIAYDIVEREGKPGLRLYVHPSPSRPPTLQPDIIVDGSDYRNARFALGARLTALDFGGFRSEWRTDFIVGTTYGIDSEYYHPFRPASNWFVAPRAYAYTRPLDFYRRSQVLSLYRQQSAGGGIDLGYSLSNTGEVRAGYETNRFQSSYVLGNRSLFPLFSGRYGASHLSYTYDHVDDEVVPRKGVFGSANLRCVDANPGANSSFPALDGRLNFFQPLSAKSSGFASVEGGTLFGRQNTGIPMFYLGGPQRLSAYGWNELYGNQFLLGRVGYLKEIAVISKLTNNKAYFVADYEIGKMYDFSASTRAPMDVNAGLLVKTILGPLFLGGSTGDAGHRKWYFQVGRFY